MMHGDSRVMVVVCLDSQFTSTLSVNFHFPKIPRRTIFMGERSHWRDRVCIIRLFRMLARKCVPNAS